MADNSAMTQFSVGDTNAMNFNQWLDANGYDASRVGNYSALGNLRNWFMGDRTKAEREYDTYLTNFQNSLEEKRLNSAREYEKYMDSTKYQRAMKDAEKAGINPYTLLSSSSLATNASSSASAVQSHKSSNQVSKKSNDILTSALKVLALIALKS